MDRIICVVGPTASGKTALAVELAKFTKGEVVSCDSMQIYRRMDIGTAKPTKEEMQGIPHHMIDIIEPDEDFSVGRYVEMATPIVEDILARGKTAIIAGGTGLYVDNLIKGGEFAPTPSTGCRERLERMVELRGIEPWRWTRVRATPGGSSGHWRSSRRPARPSPPTMRELPTSRPGSIPSGSERIMQTARISTTASTCGFG